MILPVAVFLSLCSPAFTYVAPVQEKKLEVLENWVTEDTVEVRVCLDPESKLDHLTRFDLIANGLGRSWRLQRLPQKMDRRLCYGGVSLEKEDLAEVTTLRITEEGGNLQEMETFFIVPDVTHVSKDVYQICWENPKKVTFLVNDKKLLHSCTHCCHTASAQGMSHLVTIESGTEGFKHVVQLKLPVKHNIGPTRIELAIKEIHKVMRDDDPTGQNQNTEVVLADHDPIDADDYKMVLTADGGQITYDCYQLPDSTATQIEFIGAFVDSVAVIVTATKDGKTVAVGTISGDIKDPGSRAAWVGDAAARSLRVNPGNSVTVDVPGRESCPSGTCYYIGLRDDPLEPPVMCETLPNVVFCDDVVPDVTNSGEMPSLELHNLKELIVALDPSSQPTEVVVSASGAIVSPNDFVCSDAGSGTTCSQQVEIADGVDNINVLIVTLSDEGLVKQSISTDFEVHRAHASPLLFDALKVSVVPVSEGNYTVQLVASSPSEISLECQAGTECRVWIDGQVMPDSINVAKTGQDDHLISQDVGSSEQPTLQIVKSITSLADKSGTRIEVAGDQLVTSVELVTFTSSIAMDEDCEDLQVQIFESGYSFDGSFREPGEWDFIVVGYRNDGTLEDVAQAKVTLRDLDTRVSVVGAAPTTPNSSIRVSTGTQANVSVVDIGYCVRVKSPCYFLKETVQDSTITHCVAINNSVNEDLQQCDESFEPFLGMTEIPKLELVDGQKMKLTVAEELSAAALEMMIFNPADNNAVISSSPLCSSSGDGSCSQDVSIPDEVRDLEVLVVALDDVGGVIGSSLTPFYDIKVSTRQLTADTLEVSWTTKEPQTYSVSLADVSPALSSPVSAATTEIGTTCSGEMCRAHFMGLTSGKSYTVMVHKEGDTNVQAGVTATMDTPVENLPPACSIKSLTTISIEKTHIEVDISSLSTTVTSAYLSLTVGTKETSWKALQVNSSGVFEVVHDGQASLVGQKVTLIFRATDDTSASCVGKVVVTLKNIDARLSWVGGKYVEGSPSSLRVDTGSLPEVKITEDLLCKRENSPCYFLRQKLPSIIPKCETLTSDDGQTIEQCDLFTSPYQALSDDPSLDLYDLKEMRLTLASAPSAAELVIFQDDNTVLSPKGYECKEILTKTCVQQVAIPGDLEHFNVMVVLLDQDGYAMQSDILPFDVYKVNVDQLTLDVFRVTLDPSSSPGDYTMQLQRKADVECEDEAVVKVGRCQAFFSRVTEASDVTVSRTGEPKSATYSVAPKEQPARSYVRSITSSNGTSDVRVQVVSSNAISRVDFVTFVQDVASGADEIIPTKEGSDYSVDVPSHGAGRWDFVVLGYGEEGTLLEVGQAYVRLEEMDASVAVVWEEDSSVSFRLDVGSLQEVVMEDVGSCKRWESPCYFLQVETEAASGAHCVLLLNSAEVEDSLTTVLQCDDSFTPFEELPGDISLSLDDSETMIVIGEFPGNDTEITIFDSVAPSVILSYNDSSCEESDGSSEQRCAQRFKSPAQERTLDVLVVTLGEEGDVQGSTLVTYTYSTEEGSSGWVIIVSVLVSVFVLAFVAYGVSVVVKKKKAKKSIRENTSGRDFGGPRPWESTPSREYPNWGEMKDTLEEETDSDADERNQSVCADNTSDNTTG